MTIIKLAIVSTLVVNTIFEQFMSSSCIIQSESVCYMYADFITHCILPRFFPHTDKAPHTHSAQWGEIISGETFFILFRYVTI